MSNTVNTSSNAVTSQTYLDAFVNLRTVDKTAIQKTGAGSGAPTGATPPPPTASREALSELSSALAAMGLSMSAKSSEILIAEVAVAMRDTQAKNEKGKIDLDQKAMQGLLKDQQAKIAEAEAKQAEAREKKESASIADKIKLAFEWIGVVVAVVVAAVMIASGVGAVVGTLLMAAALTALVMAIDSTMKITNKDGLGMAGQAAVGRGESLEKAKKDDMITGIALAVSGAVFSIAGGGASTAMAVKSAVQAGFQAGRAAYATAKTVADVAKPAWEAAKMAYSASLQASQVVMSTTLKTVKAGAETAEAFAMMGTTASGMASGIQNAQATEIEAGAKRSEGQAKDVEAMMAMINDMLDQAFTRLFAAGDRFNQMMDAIMENQRDKANITANFKFTG